MTRYLIIGSGVAGVAAAQAIRRQDAAGEIMLLSDDPHGYYSRPGMAYLLTGEQQDRFLFPLSDKYFHQQQIQRRHDRVTEIHPDRRQVVCSSKHILIYDRLLIATGSTATRLSVPGIDLEGVVKLDDLEDAKRIMKLARKGHPAVVVGGGITALELVEGLIALGAHVHLFMHGERYWNSVLDPNESAIVEQRLRSEGVEIHPHTELTEVVGKHGKVNAVLTQDGKKLPANLLAYAIGVKPVKELAQACGLKVDRGILVDPWMKTSQPDIFAAGDVAQVYDSSSGKWIVESLWGPAARQGLHAGQNMAGLCVAYVRPPAVNVTRLTGITTAIIGAIGRGKDEDLLTISHGDSEGWLDRPDAIVTRADHDIHHLRVLVGEKTLVGAVVMGDQTLTPALHELVSHQVDISPIRSALIAPDAPVAVLIKDFWDGIRNDLRK